MTHPVMTRAARVVRKIATALPWRRRLVLKFDGERVDNDRRDSAPRFSDSLARTRCAMQQSNGGGRGIVPCFALTDGEQRLLVAQRGRPVRIIVRVLADLAEAAALVERDRRLVIVAHFQGERHAAVMARVGLAGL